MGSDGDVQTHAYRSLPHHLHAFALRLRDLDAQPAVAIAQSSHAESNDPEPLDAVALAEPNEPEPDFAEPHFAEPYFAEPDFTESLAQSNFAESFAESLPESFLSESFTESLRAEPRAESCTQPLEPQSVAGHRRNEPLHRARVFTHGFSCDPVQTRGFRRVDPDCCGTDSPNATQRQLMGVRRHWGWLVPATLLTISCGEDEGSVWDGQGQSGDTRGDDDDDAESNDGAATGTAGATGTGGDDDDDDSADDTGGVKLDVGPDTDGGVDGACGCQYSYIWVANTEESTVSKINTKTLEEEGRYRKRSPRARAVRRAPPSTSKATSRWPTATAGS